MPACVRAHRFNGGRHRRTFGAKIHDVGKTNRLPQAGQAEIHSASQGALVTRHQDFRPSNDFAISKGALVISLKGF